MLKAIYTTLGLVSLGLGLRLGASLWSFVALSAGVGLLFVGLAYWRGWPGVLGKRRDGRLMFSSYLLFWPYHVINWCTYLFFRWGVRERAFDLVAPGVYLGRLPGAGDRRMVERTEIRSVLDLTAEFTEATFLRALPRYACIPILDRTALTPKELELAVAFVEGGLEHGAVYVHCALGHGRSALAVAAWLLKSRKAATPEEAMGKLKMVRPGVNPSRAQRRALAAYAGHL